MTYLFFKLNETKERQEEFRDLLRQYSEGVSKSVVYLVRTLQLMEAGRREDNLQYHGIVFLLARHVVEEFDAVSILIAKGCVEPCKSHLRSAFEAELGIRYILEADCERRALAYLVKHARERVKWYNKIDPNSQSGKQLRSQCQTDNTATEVLSSLASCDFKSERDRFNSMLQMPPYYAINIEWERIKKDTRRQPSWHSLFDGPKRIRDLAIHLKRGFWYEVLYSDWSRHIHALSGVSNVGRNNDDPTGESESIRPIRHPGNIKTVYFYGQAIPIILADTLSKRYLSQIGQDDLAKLFNDEIKPIYDLVKNISIVTDWR